MTAFLVEPAARKQNWDQKYSTTPICISKKGLACIFHLTLHGRTLLFPLWACCRIPVTSTPTATYPVNRFPIGFSRHPHKTTVLTALVSLNNASSVLHFRSALRHATDDFFSAFSYTLSTPTFARSTYKCFAISTCMAIAEGPPPSHKEHCLYFIESSGIQDTPCDKPLLSILDRLLY